MLGEDWSPSWLGGRTKMISVERKQQQQPWDPWNWRPPHPETFRPWKKSTGRRRKPSAFLSAPQMLDVRNGGALEGCWVQLKLGQSMNKGGRQEGWEELNANSKLTPCAVSLPSAKLWAAVPAHERTCSAQARLCLLAREIEFAPHVHQNDYFIMKVFTKAIMSHLLQMRDEPPLLSPAPGM